MDERRNTVQAAPQDLSSSRPSSTHEDRILLFDERQEVASASNETPQDQGDDEHPQVSCTDDSKDIQHKSHLICSKHALTIFIWYAVLALLTWICTCVMIYRPLTTLSYGYSGKDDFGVLVAADHAKYVTNDKLYRAIRILQSVVAMLTIPTTSAICSQAAVIFIQRKRFNVGLTLRQMMVLADKGWTEIGLVSDIIHEGWKMFGSRFLLVAVAIHILGERSISC